MFNITLICKQTVSKCHPEMIYKIKSTILKKKTTAIGVDHRPIVSLMFCLRENPSENPSEFNSKLFSNTKFHLFICLLSLHCITLL